MDTELITCWVGTCQTVFEIDGATNVYLEQDGFGGWGAYDSISLDRAAAHALYRALKNRFEN